MGWTGILQTLSWRWNMWNQSNGNISCRWMNHHFIILKKILRWSIFKESVKNSILNSISEKWSKTNSLLKSRNSNNRWILNQYLLTSLSQIKNYSFCRHKCIILNCKLKYFRSFSNVVRKIYRRIIYCDFEHMRIDELK